VRVRPHRAPHGASLPVGRSVFESGRPETGGYPLTIGYVGVPHGVELDGGQLFFAQRGLMGGPAPVRRFLPHLMDLVAERTINPGKVFDLTLPLADVAEGYRAMDERRAIKTMLRV
jgi:threonine dehydrogenase-like Zn-dependent dehydrogenase